MSATGKECSLCNKLGLKPITKENVFHHYIPLTSMVSYGALAVNVTNPALMGRLIPNRDITNILLIETLIGTSLYIYNRPHLRALPAGKKAAYSVLGSILFGLGSVLLWAMTCSATSRNNVLSTVLGLATGAAIVKVGQDYFAERDKEIK